MNDIMRSAWTTYESSGVVDHKQRQNKNCRVIPDEAGPPESSESTPCSSSLLSEHTPADHSPSWPQSDREQKLNQIQQTTYKNGFVITDWTISFDIVW